MLKVVSAVVSLFGRAFYDLATMRCRIMGGCPHASEEGYPTDCDECRACACKDDTIP